MQWLIHRVVCTRRTSARMSTCIANTCNLGVIIKFTCVSLGELRCLGKVNWNAEWNRNGHFVNRWEMLLQLALICCMYEDSPGVHYDRFICFAKLPCALQNLFLFPFPFLSASWRSNSVPSRSTRCFFTAGLSSDISILVFFRNSYDPGIIYRYRSEFNVV